MTQITIEIPERLAPRLEPVQPYVIEFMEAGLHKMNLEGNPLYQELLTFFRSSPTSQQIIDLHASEVVEAHIDTLLQKNKANELTEIEKQELVGYGRLDDFITLVKARLSSPAV